MPVICFLFSLACCYRPALMLIVCASRPLLLSHFCWQNAGVGRACGLQTVNQVSLSAGHNPAAMNSRVGLSVARQRRLPHAGFVSVVSVKRICVLFAFCRCWQRTWWLFSGTHICHGPAITQQPQDLQGLSEAAQHSGTVPSLLQGVSGCSLTPLRLCPDSLALLST